MVGDDLDRIARKYYGDASKSSLIAEANKNVISGMGDVLKVGSKLVIPNEAETEIVKEDGVLRIAGNANFPPFSQADGYKEGMSTEIVRAVFKEMKVPIEIEFTDANRAKAATFNGSFIATYPYVKTSADEQNLLFSESLYKVLNVFFVKKNSDIVFEKPRDLKGKTVAVARGYEIAQLQDFYAKGFINIRPCRSLEECFDLLEKGTVDMVAASEIVGWCTLNTMPLLSVSNFKTLEQSIENTSIHLVISKNHPMGEEIINQFNQALARLVTKGTVAEIQDRHIDKIQRGNRP
jgi:polar amino acid transport system substrate-binding protein